MDTSWYLDINHFAAHTPWAHEVMKALAIYGVGLFGVFALVAWYVSRRNRDAMKAVAASLWVAFGTLVAVGLNQLIVSAVHRLRPYQALAGVEVLVGRTHDASFPSDHALTAGAATAGLWIVAHYGSRTVRRLAIASTALALIIAFSRVYVGAHYPSDVVVGLGVGAAMCFVGWIIARRALIVTTMLIAKIPPLRTLVIASRP